MTPEEKVKNYFQGFESRYGYKLILKDAQHFGYYPNRNDNISETEAQKELHNLLANNLELDKPKRVLDAGCGRGVVACDLAVRFGANIEGIDITPYIVKKAQKRVTNLGLEDKVNIQEGDYSRINFPDESFDAVYTVETLSHAGDLDLVLSEFYRILKPGGIGVFIEYEIAPFNQFNNYEIDTYSLVKGGSAMNSLDEFIEGNFIKKLESTRLTLISDKDITKNRSKSMKRLYSLALLPYQVIKLLGLRKQFINTTAGVEFYKLNEKNLFRYHTYKVVKND